MEPYGKGCKGRWRDDPSSPPHPSDTSLPKSEGLGLVLAPHVLSPEVEGFKEEEGTLLVLCFQKLVG